MRVIGGKYRGRKLKSPIDDTLRPTSEKTRAAIFNILTNSKRKLNFSQIRVLDLFCGTGALGIEALSRGAAYAAFVDKSRKALDLTMKNVESIFAQKKITIFRADIAAIPYRKISIIEKYNLVFIDPPYGLGFVLPTLVQLEKYDLLSANALVVIELSKSEKIEISTQFKIIDSRIYGKTQVLFLEKNFDQFSENDIDLQT